jgi:hypothetical protein
MPSSIIGYAIGSMVTTVATEWAATAVLSFVLEASIATVATGIGGLAGFVVSSGLRAALSSDTKQADQQSFTSQATQRTVVIRSPVAPRQTIYGRCMASGPLIFGASSADNNTIHLVIALAGHECTGIDEIWFGDDLLGARDANGNVTTGAYAGYAQVVEHLGSPDQLADDVLVNANVGWTANHRLRGVCYLRVTLTWNRDVYPRGIPNIKAVTRGKPLYDPRSALTAYSTNWALMVRDYLSGTHGLSASAAEISDTDFIAAANIADEAVTLAAGGTEPRYAVNGVVSSGSAPLSTMEQMLSAGAGILVWTQGVYRLLAGAYVPPTVTLDENILRGSMSVRARVTRKDLYNAVRGTYVDPVKYWQPGDFTPVQNALYAGQDGEEIFRDIELPFTTSAAAAQRLAKIILEKGRQGIVVDMPCKPAAFKIAVGDTVRLTIAHLGWSLKEFRVLAWQLADNGAVDLSLQEESSAAYAWSAEETIIDTAPDTNLPNAFIVATPGAPEVTESLFETTGSAGLKARATLTWPASEDGFVVDYLPEYRLVSGDWIRLPAVNDLTVNINDIQPGIYEFRLRARNVIGVTSDYSAVLTREVLGLMAPPANVTGFSVIKSGGFAKAAWSLHPDIDVRIGGRIVIRHSPLSAGAEWYDGIILDDFNGDAVSGDVPLMTGTYMIKALDSSGNYSTVAASFVATEGMVTGLVTVGSITLSPDFIGSKTSVGVLSGALQLITDELFDSAEDIDSTESIDGGGIAAAGQCDFTNVLDLGTSAVRRIQATISARSFDIGDFIDSTDDIDSAEDIDGSVINDCDATLYCATTPDDPVGSPVWSAWQPFFVGDFEGRALKFRLALTSGSPSHNLAVTALSVSAKIPV